ncbi:MAG: 50S ribosomal protein L4 [Oligoflexales bacterium]|nr:50S ribosomal protein L4 [Oligoflexales bacterium]
MNWDVLNISGERVRSVSLPQSVYGLEMNEPLLHSIVKAFRANKRQGTHATKTRAFVSGGGKKPFRQKGTGEARQGTTRSPLMPGGAVCHGPQPRSYRHKLNQKMKRLALCVALSDKVRHKRLTLIDSWAIGEYRTKAILETLGALKHSHHKKVLISDERTDDFLYRSARNLHGVQVVHSSSLNVEDVLDCEALILSESALQVLEKRLNQAEV